MVATALQRRRGSTAQHASFTGLLAEITIDTDKHTVVVHDGATAGGYPLAKATDASAVEVQVVAGGAVTTIGDTDLLANVQTTGPVLKKITWLNLKATMVTAWGGLIAGMTAKGTPTTSDLFAISDQAASGATKMTSISNLLTIIGPWLAGVTGKTTPVGGDGVLITDSAASGANKLLTLTNLLAYIFTAFGGKIAGGTNKATPVAADMMVIADSASSNATKYITLTNLFAVIWTALGGLIAGGTSKTTVAGTDLFAISDQAASSATKMVSFSNLFATLGTFYAAFTAKTTPVDADIVTIADSAASSAVKGVTLANLATYIIGKITTFVLLAGNQTVTGGFDYTGSVLASWASFTIAPKAGNGRWGTNTGTITITAPATDTLGWQLMMTNGAGAVVPTMTGFSGTTTGDTPDTTSGHSFLLQVVRLNGISTYSWKAMQ